MRALTIASVAVASLSATWAQPLRFEKSIPLACGEGRLGQLALDTKEQRLFVPVLTSGIVDVIDVTNGKRLRSINGFRAPVSAAFDPVSNRLFVSSRQDGSVSIVDGKSYALLQRIIWPGNADTLRFEPSSKQVLVAYGTAVGVMDINGRQLGSIRLDAAPESFHASRSGPQVWINVPSTRAVAFADRNSRSVRQTWLVSTAGSGGPNYGMAADEKNRRLFVTCRRPATLVTLHLDTGYRIDTRATVNNADEVHYDAANRRLYIPGSDGQIDIVRQTTPDKYEPLARIPSAPGARTAALSAELGRFFLAIPGRGSQSAEVRVYQILK
ncbi:MAG TPA: WD40 repeat domain-containing protein [Bryobacteraceae bacterium]|nr:WD40 repeat domain-containing protein [Bryobacteraceae bacterium]